MICAYSIPMGFASNNKVELQPAIYGIRWCLQFGYKHVELEVDSKLIITLKKHNTQVPSQLFHYIQELKCLSSQLNSFQVYHVYREANTSADLLAKQHHTLEELQHLYVYQYLPLLLKGSYLIDKMGMINFRRRKLKRIKVIIQICKFLFLKITHLFFQSF